MMGLWMYFWTEADWVQAPAGPPEDSGIKWMPGRKPVQSIPMQGRLEAEAPSKAQVLTGA